MKNIIYIAIGTVLILLIPFLAMQFTGEVNWDETDFIVAGVLIFGTGLLFELLSRKLKTKNHKIILAVVLLVLFLIVWADLAVGIFNIPGFSGS